MKISREWVLIGVMGLVILASGMDLSTDLAQGAPETHIIKEALIVLIAAAIIIWIWCGLHQQAREMLQLKEALDSQIHVERMSEDVQQMRRQLRDVVERQFREWQLTESEKAVGWLLLKGLSLKEIAIIRETLEKTVRQQASSIYKKAGLSGRHAFSAWFIEDLL